jgi:hypothetical protein
MPTIVASKPEQRIFQPAKPGDYSFEIVDYKAGKLDKPTAKLEAGTEFVEIKLLISDGDRDVKVRDKFFFASSTQWRLDHLLKAIGKHPGEDEVVAICGDEFSDDYTDGAVALIGEKGRVTIGLSKDKAWNEVKAYIWDEEK